MALLLAAPAGAVSPEAAATRRVAGGSMVQLAAQSAVATLLRGAARGRQQQVYEGLRLPGPPVVLVEDRWLVGWGCADPPARTGCSGRGLFMAFDAGRERLFLMLLEDGEPVYLAPARTGHWPAMLAEAFSGFAPELARPPVFDQE